MNMHPTGCMFFYIKCCNCAYKIIKCKHNNNNRRYYMDYRGIIESKLEENNGILLSCDIKACNIPSIYLTRMVNEGILTRISRGVYLSAKGDYDEYYLFQKQYGVPIFSYASALYLHQFTDDIYPALEVTVYKGYNVHRFNNVNIVHYVTKDIYELGITECKTVYDNPVKTYDLERTICDFIKNRNKVDTELFSKTIYRYMRYKNRDLNRLYKYAKKMKIYDKVKSILEVIYE